MKNEIYCSCICHQDGKDIRHFMACCHLTYKKYITKDGKIDLDRLQSLIKDRNEKPK